VRHHEHEEEGDQGRARELEELNARGREGSAEYYPGGACANPGRVGRGGEPANRREREDFELREFIIDRAHRVGKVLRLKHDDILRDIVGGLNFEVDLNLE